MFDTTSFTYFQLFTYLTVDLRDKDYSNLLSCIPAANIFIEAGLESGGNILVHWYFSLTYERTGLIAINLVLVEDQGHLL